MRVWAIAPNSSALDGLAKGVGWVFLAPQGQHKTLPLAVYRPTEYTFR